MTAGQAGGRGARSRGSAVAVAALVLAAGAGTRFGPEPKLLAEVNGHPILEHAVRAACEVPALERIVVVLGAHAEAMLEHVDFLRAEPVVCSDLQRGQSASLRCGLRALAGYEKVVVLLGDQPLVTPALIARFATLAPGVRAASDGVPGHPAVLGPQLIHRAMRLEGDQGLAGESWRLIECGDAAGVFDVDTKPDLAAVRKQARSGTGAAAGKGERRVRTAVVLPVKHFGLAKQRLSHLLTPRERRSLMEAMLADVFSALKQVSGCVHELIVVTADPAAAAQAQAAGAQLVDEGLERGHSAAAEVGVAVAEHRGAERVLLIPGDCPLLDPAEVAQLLAPEPTDHARIVIVPDEEGHGTNALLLQPPRVLTPAFGPGSFTRHIAAARAAGARVEVSALPSLTFDVDTPAQVAALRKTLDGKPGLAPHTAAVLDRLARAT